MRSGPRYRRRLAALVLAAGLAAVLGAPATAAPGCAAPCFTVEDVPGTADVLEPVLAATGTAQYLTGRSPALSSASPLALVRTPARPWTPLPEAGPVPRRPAARAAIAAAGDRALRIDAGAGLAALTAWAGDGAAEERYELLPPDALASAACGATGASAGAVATDGTATAAALLTLPPPDAPTQPGLLLVAGRANPQAPLTSHCTGVPAFAVSRPALRPGGSSYDLPVVRVLRGLPRLLVLTGTVGATAPPATAELGEVAGTTLACDTDAANTGLIATGRDGTRVAAAVAPGARAVRVWAGAGTGFTDVDAGGPVTGVALAATTQGAALAVLTAADGCDRRELRLARLDAAGASEFVPVATGLPAGCGPAIDLAVKPDDRAVIAVQVGQGGDCSRSAATGRGVRVFTELPPPQPKAAGHPATPTASAFGRSRAAERSHRAR